MTFMRALTSAAAAIALLIAACATADAAGRQPVQSGHGEPRDTWIVSFQEPPAAAYRADGSAPGAVIAKRAGLAPTSPEATGAARLNVADAAVVAYRSFLANQRADRLADAGAALGRTLEPLFVYELAINGVALRLTEAEARRLAGIDGVRRVERERIYRMQTDFGPRWIGADAIWTGAAGVASRGEGIVVGIIDSGIHAAHPAFAATGPVDGHMHTNPRSQFFGQCVASPGRCNGKLIGIHDFTDEGSRDGSDASGHGTHVASIAVGNVQQHVIGGGTREISGVAPHASLITYKVCVADDPATEDDEAGCNGGAILRAVEQSIIDHADVINMSLGGPAYDPWLCFGIDCDGDGSTTDTETVPQALLNAREAGVLASVSAGNSGPDPLTVSSPGVEPWVLTVASISHDRVPANADILAGDSSRGPSIVGGALAPDVSAPGVQIVAADHDSMGVVTFSGTSMAAPHAAGAAALLRAVHPDWTVSDVIAALVTTARPSVRVGNRPATVFEQGAGVIALGEAVKAGLSFRATAAEFTEANPSAGGTPGAVNQPDLVHDTCLETCTLVRRATDLVGGGTWRVVVDTDGPGTVTASPTEFTLAAGGTRSIEFDIDVASMGGEWLYGDVRFERTDATGTPPAVLPLAVFASTGELPAVQIDAQGESGFVDVPVSGVLALPDARFDAGPLSEMVATTRSLAQDPTRDDPYDGFPDGATETTGAFFTLVTVPANSGELELTVRTLDSTAEDIDLYVGRDISADHEPQKNEEQCASTTSTAIELCHLDVPNRAIETRYWILVQNWSASAAGATDTVTVEHALLDPAAEGDGTLTATGPGHVATAEPFSVRIAWKDFTLTPGSSRLGVVRVGASPSQPGSAGTIPVLITRVGASAPMALQSGVSLPLRLQPGGAKDRLYIDVPPNASSLTLATTGTGEVDLYAAHVTAGDGPAIPAAPARTSAQASSTQAGAAESITLSGAQLTPGRWYVTPQNAGDAVADAQLTATLAYDVARAPLRFGAYFNPARSGAGGFIYQAGGAWAFIWYAYLQDGTPSWYLGVAARPGDQQGSFVVPLERYTWNGSATHRTHVGEGVLTLLDANSFQFNWNLDGQSGSERYVFIDGGGCPDASVRDLTGSWFQPSLSGYGYSVNAYPGLESNAAYFYDGQGVARWAFGIAAPFGTETLVLSQHQGACPLCSYSAPTTTEVGTYTRSYDSARTGEAALELELVPPLQGVWSTSGPIEKLTDDIGCD